MKAKTTITKKVTAKKVTKKPSTTKKVTPATLTVGSKVPAFSMPSTSGGVVSNKSLMGTRYVLYFYPKDMTSGCTVEAHEFTDLAKKFGAMGVQVFGVSPDSIASHEKFIKKDGITFPLLADEDHKVALAFGVWVEKSLYGRKYMGINRSTFVVGADGKLEAVYANVKPEGHAVCVLGDMGGS